MVLSTPCLLGLLLVWSLKPASGTNNGENQNEASTSAYNQNISDYSQRNGYSSNNGDNGSRVTYTPTSSVYTPGMFSYRKSLYNPPMYSTKGDLAGYNYPGYRNYNSLPSASTMYNSYNNLPTASMMYNNYKGYYGQAGPTYRPYSDFSQARSDKNNWQNNYRFVTGTQDYRSKWSHSPPMIAPTSYRAYGGLGTKAGLTNYQPYRDSRIYHTTRVGQLPGMPKKTGIYVIPTPSKLYHDGMKN